MTTDTDRHYAMGILAAKKAMRDGNAFAAMCNQAEEVLAKETPEEEVIRLRDQLRDCETSLNIFDEGRVSEYWMRHGDQPSNE